MTNPQRPSYSSKEQGRGINDPLTRGDEDGLEEVEQATSQSSPTIITREGESGSRHGLVFGETQGARVLLKKQG